MNTHRKYNTVGHIHFDFCYQVGDDSRYPGSALRLVECADGRWYLEQEFGTEYEVFPGVVKSSTDLDTLPTFFPDVDTAARAAFAFILQVYPGTSTRHLEEFLNEEN